MSNMYHDNYLEELKDQAPVSEYLTPQEVMDLLYIGKNTLYKLLNSGKLKGFRVGSLWRIQLKDLEAYVADCKRDST